MPRPPHTEIEIDAERARRFEQARGVGELAAFSGRREDDTMGQEINRFEVIGRALSSVLSVAKASIQERHVLSGKTFAAPWTPAFAGVT